jgi:hypothetical protein
MVLGVAPHEGLGKPQVGGEDREGAGRLGIVVEHDGLEDRREVALFRRDPAAEQAEQTLEGVGEIAALAHRDLRRDLPGTGPQEPGPGDLVTHPVLETECLAIDPLYQEAEPFLALSIGMDRPEAPLDLGGRVAEGRDGRPVESLEELGMLKEPSRTP